MKSRSSLLLVNVLGLGLIGCPLVHLYTVHQLNGQTQPDTSTWSVNAIRYNLPRTVLHLSATITTRTETQGTLHAFSPFFEPASRCTPLRPTTDAAAHRYDPPSRDCDTALDSILPQPQPIHPPQPAGPSADGGTPTPTGDSPPLFPDAVAKITVDSVTLSASGEPDPTQAYAIEFDHDARATDRSLSFTLNELGLLTDSSSNATNQTMQITSDILNVASHAIGGAASIAAAASGMPLTSSAPSVATGVQIPPSLSADQTACIQSFPGTGPLFARILLGTGHDVPVERQALAARRLQLLEEACRQATTRRELTAARDRLLLGTTTPAELTADNLTARVDHLGAEIQRIDGLFGSTTEARTRTEVVDARPSLAPSDVCYPVTADRAFDDPITSPSGVSSHTDAGSRADTGSPAGNAGGASEPREHFPMPLMQHRLCIHLGDHDTVQPSSQGTADDQLGLAYRIPAMTDVTVTEYDTSRAPAITRLRLHSRVAVAQFGVVARLPNTLRGSGTVAASLSPVTGGLHTVQIHTSGYTGVNADAIGSAIDRVATPVATLATASSPAAQLQNQLTQLQTQYQIRCFQTTNQPCPTPSGAATDAGP